MGLLRVQILDHLHLGRREMVSVQQGVVSGAEIKTVTNNRLGKKQSRT